MNITALPGSALVRPLSKYNIEEKGIIIPENVRKVKGNLGTVADYKPYPVGLEVWIWQGNRRVMRPAWYLNKDYEGLVGKTVLYETGRQFEQLPLFAVRLEHILAIIDAPVEAIKAQTNVGLPPRCQWCKSAGEANILLDAWGHCVVCGRNNKGEYRDDNDNGPMPRELQEHFAAAESKPVKSGKIMVGYTGR